MSTKTPNYELIKPELTDVADITAMNANWDKIDTELEKRLPKSGGTLTGALYIEKDGERKGWIEPVDGEHELNVIATNDPKSIIRYLNINADDGVSLKDIINVIDGSVIYRLYGEHNKPTAEDIDAIPSTAFVEAGTDLNTVTSTGIYRIEGTVVNAPTNVEWCQLLVMHGGGDTVTQIIGSYSDGLLWHRSGNPSNAGGTGAWSNWAKVYDSENKPTLGDIGAAPAYTYGTADLTAGSSALESGTLYFVYE